MLETPRIRYGDRTPSILEIPVKRATRVKRSEKVFEKKSGIPRMTIGGGHILSGPCIRDSCRTLIMMGYDDDDDKSNNKR